MRQWHSFVVSVTCAEGFNFRFLTGKLASAYNVKMTNFIRHNIIDLRREKERVHFSH